jgi:hypothetical protein
MSSIAIRSYSAVTSTSVTPNAAFRLSSYDPPLLIALSKMLGLEVTPRRPSRSTSRFRPPSAMKSRSTKSSQTAWRCS